MRIVLFLLLLNPYLLSAKEPKRETSDKQASSSETVTLFHVARASIFGEEGFRILQSAKDATQYTLEKIINASILAKKEISADQFKELNLKLSEIEKTGVPSAKANCTLGILLTRPPENKRYNYCFPHDESFSQKLSNFLLDLNLKLME